MATYEELKHIIPIIYIIPTFILYFIILYVIFFSPVKQKFSASFYWLFGFSSINYMIHTISYYIVYRFNSIPLFLPFQETWPKESLFYPIIYFLTYYSAFGIHTYSFALSFNRFSIFILKTRFISFWKKYLKFFLALCIIIPLLLSWHISLLNITHELSLKGVIWMNGRNRQPLWWKLTRNLLIQISFTSFSSLVMNIYVIISVINMRMNISNNAKQISSQDSAMIFYSMLIFSTELASCIQQLMLQINPDLFQDFVNSTQFILADISTLAPAWFVVAINSDLRKEIINLFIGKKYDNTFVISSTVNTVQPRINSTIV